MAAHVVCEYLFALAELDAIILAEDSLAQVRIAGLSAGERALRVARRVGAARAHVVTDRAQRADLVAWRGARTGPLLVIRADQLVHTPLVAPLIEMMPTEGVVAAVGVVGDLTSYAGALVAAGAAATASLEALANGAPDMALVASATPVQHGAIARAPIATPRERRAAHALLYQILVKPQDNAITRYLYRPISFALTRLLVWTPITPNQISYIVAAMVAIGCWLTAHASDHYALAGTIVVLAASYLDCCDGEVARVKLLSSRFGAWVDTVVDELSSVGFMIALGWHCHLALGPSYLGELPFDPWKAGIAFGAITYLWSIYFIYYNIIVAVGSANSQDYVGRFEVAPGRAPSSVRLVPKPIEPARVLPQPLAWFATYAPYVVRRDFLSWAAVAFVAAGVPQIMFAGLVLGGIVTSVILAIDHARLRSLRRSCARRGLLVEAPQR